MGKLTPITEQFQHFLAEQLDVTNDARRIVRLAQSR